MHTREKKHIKLKVRDQVSTPVQNGGLVSGLPSEQVGEQVSEQVTKLLVAIENDKVSMAHLRDILNINSRSYIHTDILTPAIVSGLVAREYPDSPNHPRQKYYLTEKGKAVLEQIQR